MDQVVRPGSIEITTQFVDHGRRSRPIPSTPICASPTAATARRQVDQIAMIRDGDGITWRGHWSSAAGRRRHLPLAHQDRWRAAGRPAGPLPRRRQLGRACADLRLTDAVAIEHGALGDLEAALALE